MPSRLEESIAQIVIQAGDDDGCSSIPSELIAAASRIAPQLKPEELAKVPNWWYPTVSAKAAGGLKWKEGWGRLWFEALVEILYQADAAGLPVLWELFDRQEKTYHGFVLVRLLRFAANGVTKKEIIDRVTKRLPELPHPAGPQAIEEVMLWSSYGEPRLRKFLKAMAKVELKGIGKETVGSVMKEWAESRGVRL